LFEVSESVRTVGAQKTEGSRRNEPNGSVIATSLSYTDEGEDVLNRIVCYWGRIMGASLPTRIKACFSALETSHFTFNQTF
jgi:hypothetical protein